MPKHIARKRFGQHFLQDPHYIARIIAAFAPVPTDHIVEIGPGLGVLTRELLRHAHALDAVELDRDLIVHLQRDIVPLGGLTLHHADALNFNFCHLVQGPQKLRVIGNLPYNISTPILFHLFDQLDCIHDMLFMLQKEVVDRMCAQAGDHDYGRLSVMLQWRCRVENLFHVPPGAFAPAPKVDSAMVRLTPHSQPLIEVRDPLYFSALVKAAFAQRRKTLRNTLKGMVTAEAMQALGIDPGRRAQTLSLEEFAALANHTTK